MNIENAITWLLEEAGRVDYGEIALKIIMHGGRVTRIERTTSVKEQCGDE